MKQLHDETQADRHAERTLALTQALGALQEVQAAAWAQLALDQGHERLVWDLFVRAAAQACADARGMHGGYTVRQPTFRPQTARLLALILSAIRQTARLECLEDPTAPAHAGDTPAEQPTNAFWYFLRRRSDEEEIAREEQQAAAMGTSTVSHPTGEPTHDPSASLHDDPDPQSAEADFAAAGLPAANLFAKGLPAGDTPTGHPTPDPATTGPSPTALDPTNVPSVPATPPVFELRDADGNPPLPTPPHPRPAIRPDGTDDWFVWKRVPLPTPEEARRYSGPWPHRRRPWDRQR